MPVSKIRKRKNSQPNFKTNKKCIFCDFRGKLTGEHAYADWTTSILPLELADKNHVHVTTISPLAPSYAPGNGVLRKSRLVSGDPGSVKLPVVCGLCNSGWMSTYQSQAKPLLGEIMSGGWADLGSDVLLVARWCVMTAMVFEFDHLDTAGFSDRERRDFNRHKYIPDSVAIWIGRSPKESPARKKYHRGYTTSAGKFQATTLHIGELLVQIVTLPELDLETVHGMSMLWNMHTIWPNPNPSSLSERPPLLNETTAQAQSRLTQFMLDYFKGIRTVISFPPAMPKFEYDQINDMSGE